MIMCFKNRIISVFTIISLLIFIFISCRSVREEMMAEILIPPQYYDPPQYCNTVFVIPYFHDTTYVTDNNYSSNFNYELHLKNENDMKYVIRIFNTIDTYHFIYHLEPGQYTTTDFFANYFNIKGKAINIEHYMFSTQSNTATIAPFKLIIKPILVDDIFQFHRPKKILYPVIQLKQLSDEEKRRIIKDLAEKHKNFTRWKLNE